MDTLNLQSLSGYISADSLSRERVRDNSEQNRNPNPRRDTTTNERDRVTLTFERPSDNNLVYDRQSIQQSNANTATHFIASLEAEPVEEQISDINARSEFLDSTVANNSPEQAVNLTIDNDSSDIIDNQTLTINHTENQTSSAIRSFQQNAQPQENVRLIDTFV